MDEKFISKVFLDNINPTLVAYDLDYVRCLLMDMVHMVIKKGHMLKSIQLKYTSYSNKDNVRKLYHKKDDTSVNATELITCR